MPAIKPSEVDKAREVAIPEEVLNVFNALIVKKWNGHSARFTQDVVVAELEKIYDRQLIFDSHYLDVEPVYRKADWTVVYDKPAYCETYSANWTFTKK